MVLTCNRSSDAMPRGNATWNGCPAAGAFAANDSASAGLAICGGLGGTNGGIDAAAAGDRDEDAAHIRTAW